MNDWEIVYYSSIGAMILALFIGVIYVSVKMGPEAGITLSWVGFASIIVLIFLADYYNWFSAVEGFHFRVTPWKQNCLLKKCNKCCKKGFHGQGRTFEYTGDRERLCGVGCHQKKQEGGCGCDTSSPVPEGDSPIVEGYCQSCEFKGNCSKCQECDVKSQMEGDEVKVEGYCSKCDGVYTPSPPIVEGYCSSCSM